MVSVLGGAEGAPLCGARRMRRCGGQNGAGLGWDGGTALSERLLRAVRAARLADTHGGRVAVLEQSTAVAAACCQVTRMRLSGRGGAPALQQEGTPGRRMGPGGLSGICGAPGRQTVAGDATAAAAVVLPQPQREVFLAHGAFCASPGAGRESGHRQRAAAKGAVRRVCPARRRGGHQGRRNRRPTPAVSWRCHRRGSRRPYYATRRA